MKDQMYLYAFLVVTSIVALILSGLSLTKKDKFSGQDSTGKYVDYSEDKKKLKKGVWSKYGDILINSKGEPMPGPAVKVNGGQGVSCDYYAGGELFKEPQLIKNGPSDTKLYCDTHGNYACSDNMGHGKTPCCSVNPGPDNAHYVGKMEDGTYKCNSQKDLTKYYCYTNPNTNIQHCTTNPPKKASIGHTSLTECHDGCDNNRLNNNNPVPTALGPDSLGDLKKGMFVNFCSPTAVPKVYGYLGRNGNGLVLLNNNDSVDAQWKTVGLSKKTNNPSDTANNVFVISDSRKNKAGDIIKSLIRGELTNPDTAVLTFPTVTEDIDTIIKGDYDGTRMKNHFTTSAQGQNRYGTQQVNSHRPNGPDQPFCWKADCGWGIPYSSCNCTVHDQSVAPYQIVGLSCGTPTCWSSEIDLTRYTFTIAQDKTKYGPTFVDPGYYLAISIQDEAKVENPSKYTIWWLIIDTDWNNPGSKIILSPDPPYRHVYDSKGVKRGISHYNKSYYMP